MSSNTFLFNATIRHQIFLQRLAGGEANDYIKTVDKVRKDINKKTFGKEFTEMTTEQRNKAMKSITADMASTYGEQNKATYAHMKELSIYEAEFGERMLQKGTQTAIKAVPQAALNKTVFITGIDFGAAGVFTIQSALSDFSKRKQRATVQVIRDGVVEGLTNQQIRKRLNTTVSSINNNHAKTLIRTLTNHVAIGARQALVEENEDVIKGVKWTSVLDGRTSAICRSLDGNLYPKKSGPRPPIHWACRSTVTPIVKEEFDVLPGVKTNRFARNEDGKSSVKGTATYNSWLKKQSKGFQEEVLGVDKAALFRKGGLSMDKFVDTNYKELSLKELKSKEPLAFDKADID